ncbi:hypothetical protein RND81_14G234300 [Saponaria officinalis]|uniref:DC1 domain-containing protein n=1 Tax=Saponaria officinalis TaxID=3572 RepID=A0AAW1GUD7_SAPOF
MFRGERYHMKLKDKSLQLERELERKLEFETSQQNIINNINSITEIINHFSHVHPLMYAEADYASFSCNSCAGRGCGKRYHCSLCKFDLHKVCAQTPLTWLVHNMGPSEIDTFGGVCREVVSTTFAHPGHDLVTEYKRRSYTCDHCNNSGNGLRFRCHACDGDDGVEFHKACAKNPTRLTTYVHPEHEAALQEM